MQFHCFEQCELPFMLNLPTDTYVTVVDGVTHNLEVSQGEVAMYLPDGRMGVGFHNVLKQRLGADAEQAHVQRLRTVVRHVTMVEVEETGLPPVTNDDLFNDMQADIVGESPGAYGGRTHVLKAEARRRLDAKQPDEMTAYRLRAAKLRFARKIPTPDRFLTALNALIRLYMQRFDDFFVEEVTLHQLASQAPLMGIYVHIDCDGELVKRYGHVGKAPPIMRDPWLSHSQDKIDLFKKDLETGCTPNSADLLEVRAKSLLERGATRSAIVEASAALDLTVSRKLREGYAKQGKTQLEVDSILKGEINFKERANRLMQEATKKRVGDLDTKLYMEVLKHRDNFRHGIAHADVEPNLNEAMQVIKDFASLRKVVDNVVPA